MLGFASLTANLHIAFRMPDRLRTKSIEQRLTCRTCQGGDFGESIGDHATSRGDHDVHIAGPGALLRWIDNAADRLGESIRNICMWTRSCNRAAAQFCNLNETAATSQIKRMMFCSEAPQIAAGVDDCFAAAGTT